MSDSEERTQVVTFYGENLPNPVRVGVDTASFWDLIESVDSSDNGGPVTTGDALAIQSPFDDKIRFYRLEAEVNLTRDEILDRLDAALDEEGYDIGREVYE